MDWKNDFYSSPLVNQVLKASVNYQDVVDFLIREGRLTQSKIVYDQCCGRGEISLLLRKKGISTLSLDYNPYCIDYLKQNLNMNGIDDKNVVLDDASIYICSPKVDIGINWFTSLGHMNNESDNYLLIKNMYDSLNERGEFYLEYFNSHYLIKNFKPFMSYKVDNVTVERTSTFDIENSLLFQSWTLTEGSHVEKYDTQIKVYSPSDLKSMMEKAGFKKFWLFSDISKNMLQIDSPRLLIIAQK